MRPALPLLAVLLTAGCTETGASRYPSLLPRAIESQSLDEPMRPAPVAAPDAALDTRISAVMATLDQASSRFASAAQSAEALIAVARGVPEGSEAWLNAQVAMSELAATRQPLNETLSDLERMAIERGAAGQPPYPALEAAVSRAETLSAEQAARIAALEAALAGN